MRKDGREKGFGIFRSLRLLAVALALSLCLSLPTTANAQCEDAGDTAAPLQTLETTDIANLNLFIQQEASYIWNILSTAFEDMATAYLTFATNVEAALNAFATEWLPIPGEMTMELHAAVVNQTYNLGWFQDAQLMTEEQSRKGNLVIDAQKRYTPSELACEIDSTGPGLNRAYQISRALNRTLALDDAPRHENAIGNWPQINAAGVWAALPTTSFNGRGQQVNGVGQQEITGTWQEYVTLFCDNTMGDPGCTAPGTDAGRHRDIGALLWGPQLTIDPTNQENIRVMQANLRFIVDPMAPDPIPQGAIPMPNNANFTQTAPGREGILERHAELAYTNAIYNTLGAMLTERIGGSRVDPTLMREAAGIPTQDFSPALGLPGIGASYRELQEAMTRDRFDDPQYIIKMLGDPVQVARERNVLSALRLQTMNDIYRRQEELLFMESAEFSRDLNNQIPHAETGKVAFPLAAPAP